MKIDKLNNSNDSGSFDGKRKLVRGILASSGAFIASQWTKPIVESVLVPVHAETSLLLQVNGSESTSVDFPDIT